MQCATWRLTPCRSFTDLNFEVLRSISTCLGLNNHYKELDLDSDASSSEIKNAYYTLSKLYHPDKNPGDEAALKRFHAISEAYAVLGDPKQRRLYDKGVLLPSSAADVEANKHEFEGEDFIKSRTQFQDQYHGEGAYCNIKSKRTSDSNARMDNYVMNVRRNRFESSRQKLVHDDLMERVTGKKVQSSKPPPTRFSASRSPYSQQPRGKANTGSPLPFLFVITIVMIAIFKLKS